MAIIPTPSLLPESETDYQKQNEIIRRLCLGIDNTILSWDTINRFRVMVSAGILDISQDSTIKLLVVDEGIGNIPLGTWTDGSEYKYVGLSYNDITSSITTAFFNGSQISYDYNRCGYWSGNYRILNKRLYYSGIIEELKRGILW